MPKHEAEQTNCYTSLAGSSNFGKKFENSILILHTSDDEHPVVTVSTASEQTVILMRV
jgi:hypothetical protein